MLINASCLGCMVFAQKIGIQHYHTGLGRYVGVTSHVSNGFMLQILDGYAYAIAWLHIRAKWCYEWIGSQ